MKLQQNHQKLLKAFLFLPKWFRPGFKINKTNSKLCGYRFLAYLHTLGITSNINNTGSRRTCISHCESPRIIVRLVMDFSLGIRLISRRMSNLCNKCVFWAFFLHSFVLPLNEALIYTKTLQAPISSMKTTR